MVDWCDAYNNTKPYCTWQTLHDEHKKTLLFMGNINPSVDCILCSEIFVWALHLRRWSSLTDVKLGYNDISINTRTL